MFLNIITQNIESTPITFFNSIIQNRIDKHIDFVNERIVDLKKEVKYCNDNLGLPVMTKQEVDIKLNFINSVERQDNTLVATYNSVNPQNIDFASKQRVNKKTLFDL